MKLLELKCAFYISILTLALGCSLAHASAIFVLGDDVGRPAAKNNAENIANFRLQGKRIPVGSTCEDVLTELQTKMGRKLTDKEIEANLPEILKATGESLEAVVIPRSFAEDDGWNCFTGVMRVSTPIGPRLMRDLKVGDEVISIDLATNTPVVNRIHKIFPAENQTIGRLINLPTPIEVSRRHRFYSSGEGLDPDFRAIGTLEPDANIYFTDSEGREFKTVPRGQYVPAGKATVYDLQLEGEPRNFIIEGVLVHNIKES